MPDPGEDIEFRDFLRFEDMDRRGLLQNDTVTMSFNITIITDSTELNNKPKVPTMKSTLGIDLSDLLNDPKYSDVTITVGRKTFYAHKAILAARSCVFSDDLDQIDETELSNIDITDMRAEVVEAVLQFIYTDDTKKLVNMTPELLHAAEKYELDTLTKWCDEGIRANLNIDNAADNLILADRYHLEETKREILKFIGSHRKQVEITDGYKALRDSHLHLLVETYELI